jgi:hypothetical protein
MNDLGAILYSNGRGMMIRSCIFSNNSRDIWSESFSDDATIEIIECIFSFDVSQFLNSFFSLSGNSFSVSTSSFSLAELNPLSCHLSVPCSDTPSQSRSSAFAASCSLTLSSLPEITAALVSSQILSFESCVLVGTLSLRTSDIVNMSLHFFSLPFLGTVIPSLQSPSDEPPDNESSSLAMILGIVGAVLVVICILAIVIFRFIGHRSVEIEYSDSGNAEVAENETEFAMNPQLTPEFFVTFNDVLSYEFDQTGEVPSLESDI